MKASSGINVLLEMNTRFGPFFVSAKPPSGRRFPAVQRLDFHHVCKMVNVNKKLAISHAI